MKLTTIFLVISLLCICKCNSQFNPYKILNVAKTAKLAEIRKAYKKLVKEWHPDKNSSPDAQDKFIQIQQAYEILSNDDKRSQYDSQGFTSDNGQSWNQPKNFRFSDFFTNGFYDFGFDDTSSTRSISSQQFFHQVIPDSHHTPQILYIYSTFCARCIVILKTSWERSAKDIEKLGVVVGTVDTYFSNRIATYLRVYSLPTVAMVYEEQYFYYNGMISYENIKSFITSQLPSNLVETITSRNLDSFVNGVHYDDKPRALLFSKQRQPTLLYVLMSIKHQKYIKFGFVSMGKTTTKLVADRYGVRGHGPILLIFKEDPESPAVTLQSTDMPRGAVNEILTIHRHMTVPRLTSQQVFDDLCPTPDGQSFHISLCAIFASNDKRVKHFQALSNLRKLVTTAFENDEQLSEWLRFTYVIKNMQQAFVRSLSGKEEISPKAEIYLLWRREPRKGFVTTLSSEFLESATSLDYSFQRFLASCMQSAHQRQFERQVRIPILNDELAPFFISRLAIQGWKKAKTFVNNLQLLREQDLMMIFISVVIIGLSLRTIFSNGKKLPRRSTNASQEVGDESDVEVDVAYSEDEDEIGMKAKINSSLKELKPSSYEELILQKTRGHLTVVVLLARSDSVVDDFTKAMAVYDKDKRLSFAYLKTDIFMSWYVELRKTSSAQPPGNQDTGVSSAGLSSLYSNATFVNSASPELDKEDPHGIVLACNGSKHWYCIFVPRIGRKRDVPLPPLTDNIFCDGDAGEKAKSIINDSLNTEGEECEERTECKAVTDALDRSSEYYSSLVRWMDRVCEGQFPRLYVRQWPGLYVRNADHYEEDRS